MKDKVFTTLIVLLLGAVIGYSGLQAYKFFTTPEPLKNYDLMFASGDQVTIGAQGYRIEGACLIFYRPKIEMAFCNYPVVVKNQVVEVSPEPGVSAPAKATLPQNAEN